LHRSLARTALGSAVAAALLVPAAPAGAIVGGTVDTVHTNVGLVRFTAPDGRFRCSGTLISPRVVLTAGHCTEGPAVDVRVSFDNQLRPDPFAAGITPAEKAAREQFYIAGTAHPDLGWDGKLTFAKQHDQGVVVLDQPATSKWPNVKPAPLLPVGTLDANQGALKNRTFTLVGYGVDIGEKKAQIVNQQRMSTTAPLKSVQSEVVTFQNSAKDSKAGGGSCFGDSGGGAFLGDAVLGDASYVNSLTCNATGSYQRVDTAYARAFLQSWIDASK